MQQREDIINYCIYRGVGVVINNRLQRVEKSLSQFDGLKNVSISLTSRLVTIEKDVKTCSAKVTELEGNIQGVSNLFDNLKVECKKVSTKLELVQANISTKSCSCEEDIESLKSTVLDLQCRSMKNNLIFTGLHEVMFIYHQNTHHTLLRMLFVKLKLSTCN